MSTVFTASSTGGGSVSRNHFLCSSVEAPPHLFKFYHEIAAIQSHLQAPLLILVLLLFPPHLQLLPPLKSLTPSKSCMRVTVYFLQTLFNIDILNSFHESWVFLMASRMVTPFQVFSLLCPDANSDSEESLLSMVAIALQNVLLK